ncbi:hypothetical protein [Roseovarius phycicola]|uniref:DUF4189 domain-containing protein n=1 Tax=Roseovarius phycicola TaxID=3080976 RepID=A0ABZ2HI98_9RHOB
MLTKLSTIFLGLVIGFIPKEGSAEIVFQSTKKKVVVLLDETLSTAGKEGLRKIRKQTYFSAFVVNQTEDVYGWAGGEHRLERAVHWAAKICKYRSENPSECKLHAVVVPKDHISGDGRRTLNQSANKEFRKYLKLQEQGTYGAFAANNYASFGYAWRFKTEVAAREGALRECRLNTKNQLANLTSWERENTTSKADLVCNVIHVSRN